MGSMVRHPPGVQIDKVRRSQEAVTGALAMLYPKEFFEGFNFPPSAYMLLPSIETARPEPHLQKNRTSRAIPPPARKDTSCRQSSYDEGQRNVQVTELRGYTLTSEP